MEGFDKSKLLEDGRTIRVPKFDDNLDLQIALDELAGGSTEALNHFLAKQAGIDPSLVRLNLVPFEPEKGDQASYSFIGKLDSLPENSDEHNHRPRFVEGALDKVKWINFLANEEEQNYEYSTLSNRKSQIRLLRLGQDERAETTVESYNHLKVKTFDLDSTPEYLCLSYVWGAPERFIPVNCDGKTLFITQNLFHALKNIFTRYTDCYLWADGICINQDNLEERAHQVRLLGQIYGGCKTVIAHPGHFRYAKVNDAEQLPSDGNDHPHPNGEEAVDLRSDPHPSQKDDPSTLKSISEGKNVAEDQATGQNIEELYSISPARAAVSLMNFIERIWGQQKDYEIYLDSQWERFQLPSIDGDGSGTWQSLLEFWEQDWLWRTWVLPECVLPRKVVIMFGDNHVVSLDAVMEFWETACKRGLPAVLRHGRLAHLFLRIMHLTPVTTFLTLRRQRAWTDDGDTLNSDDTADEGSSSDAQLKPHKKRNDIKSVWKEIPDLLKLLILSRGNGATDDRDKVYALLGLADDSISRTIQPNYHESNTVLQTFTDVARRYVDAGRGIELLENAGISHVIKGLPSWVPDWTKQSRSRFDTKLYTTSRESTDSVHFPSGDLDRLGMKGVTISKVPRCGPSWLFYSNEMSESTFAPLHTRQGEIIEIPPFPDEDARCFLLTFAMGVVEDPDPLTAELYSDGLEQAVARSLCADRSWSGHRLSESEAILGKFMNSYRSFRQFYAREPDPDPEQLHLKPGFHTRVHTSGIFHWLLDFSEDEGDKLMQELWPFAMAMQEAMKGRCWTILESGHMALLPWDAKIGDEVVIVKGSRLPFLLRKVVSKNPDGEREFQLVGDCYVHGIMDGEALVSTSHAGEKQKQTTNESKEQPHEWKVLLSGAQSPAEWEDFIVV